MRVEGVLKSWGENGRGEKKESKIEPAEKERDWLAIQKKDFFQKKPKKGKEGPGNGGEGGRVVFHNLTGGKKGKGGKN